MINRDELKQRLRDMIGELVDDARQERASKMPWIFRPVFDIERWVNAFVTFTIERMSEHAQAAMSVFQEHVDYKCACRCKLHGKYACPLCLNVFGCPVHSDITPKQLTPGILRNPERLAQAFWTTYADLLEDQGHLATYWERLSPLERLALVETCRRLVTVRMQGVEETATHGEAEPHKRT